MEPAKIGFYEHPPLRQPHMVAAFIGWPEAARVFSGTATYLINKLCAKKLGGTG